MKTIALILVLILAIAVHLSHRHLAIVPDAPRPDPTAAPAATPDNSWMWEHGTLDR